MAEVSRVGQPLKLIDGRDKITGKTRYAPDLKIAGMLHARFVPSLYAHANILGIDPSEALKVPGVHAVLTAEDMPDIAPSSRTKLLLARKRVIFAGQPVALVLAETEAAAEDGVALVRVQYEELPAALNVEEAMADDAPRVWPRGVPTGSEDAGAHGTDTGGAGDIEEGAQSNVSSERTYERGDVNTGMVQADVIVERRFSSPMVHQSSVETQSVIVQPDIVTGGATVWASTQGQFGIREEIAEVIGALESDVRVIGTPVGGAFGAKFGLYEPLAAAAAKAVGRPVKLILTRSEELAAANPAPPLHGWLRVGAKNDGTITAIEGEVYLDAGCYPSGLANFVGYMIASTYPVDNFHIHCVNVMTFKQSDGAYRAPGMPTAFLAIDTTLDELAERLNIDPIDLRLKNIARQGSPTAAGAPWNKVGSVEVLETAKNHPLWQNRDALKQQGRGSKRRGVGVAVGSWMGGREPAAAACRLNRDGLLHVHVGSSDLTGTLTGFSLVAAEAFGVDASKVRVVSGDTETAPYAGGAGGSKTMYSVGSAVMKAAQDARQQALTIAAEEFEASVEDLEIIDGEVRIKGVPDKSIKLGEIAAKTMAFGGKYAPVHGTGRTAITDQSPAFCAQLAEVEVDQETGEVKVLKVVVVQDVGKAINPLTVQGQIHGGAVQGIGWALYEKMDYSDTGQLLSGSWMDYAVPDAEQAAEIEAILVEVPSDAGPFGVRGVGEPPVIPTAAAIANAIAHATGARVGDIPITAPRLLSALHNRNGQ